MIGCEKRTPGLKHVTSGFSGLRSTNPALVSGSALALTFRLLVALVDDDGHVLQARAAVVAEFQRLRGR
eukprot:1022649-Heterocapsa_arctica.AAC.1